MNLIKDRYDIVVVGAGHAGCEAALIAARMGCETLLVTSKRSSVAMMPCNPSIGGLAKSHLVHEIDALGGEMGINTDRAGIQFKTLNLSRGPAVWATRVQCDKKQYSKRMLSVIESTPHLTLFEGEVTRILQENTHLQALEVLADGESTLIFCEACVITTGTSLRGRTYIGHEEHQSAGDGRPTSNALSASLHDLGFQLIRLKTGTPPRLYRESIDFSKTVCQPGDDPAPFFSLQTQMFHVEHSRYEIAESVWKGVLCGEKQQPCWMSHTTARTHEIIRSHLKDSALYGGDISGTGVRYCPSIEDKIVKFVKATQHHVMLEPEGRDPNDLFYPNGLSNSLPREIQNLLVHSVPGLEHAEFAAYAYAIEYDSIDARELSHTFESKRIHGLFFAGQVNGTTGYEEAAGQGLMAGINAARLVQHREPIVLSRQDAYLGVMADDLVTKGTQEPYRMFTSRAERRLILRQDNVRYRLEEVADEIGVLQNRVREQTRCYREMITEEIKRLRHTREGETLLSVLLSRPGITYATLPQRRSELPEEVKSQVEILIKYEGYIQQEERAAQRAKQEESVKIPGWLDYRQISSLRFESREKLLQVRPENLGQAARIPGVNPADIAILSLWIKRGPTSGVKNRG